MVVGTFRKLLCGVDVGGVTEPLPRDTTQAVLRAADREARLHGAELVVLHALPLDPGAPMTPEAAEEALLQRQKLAREIIDAISEALELMGRSVADASVLVEDGPADRAILDAAARLNADLIVVGNTGARGLRRWLLGSAAAAVVRDARAAVLVIRIP